VKWIEQLEWEVLAFYLIIMKSKLFTLEKAPFLTVALFSYSLAFKYFEDLRRAIPKSPEYDHAFTLFVIFLFSGTLSIGLYIGFLISERNIAKNLEKNKRPRS
jgi:hypothetical protein